MPNVIRVNITATGEVTVDRPDADAFAGVPIEWSAPGADSILVVLRRVWDGHARASVYEADVSIRGTATVEFRPQDVGGYRYHVALVQNGRVVSSGFQLYDVNVFSPSDDEPPPPHRH